MCVLVFFCVTGLVTPSMHVFICRWRALAPTFLFTSFLFFWRMYLSYCSFLSILFSQPSCRGCCDSAKPQLSSSKLQKAKLWDCSQNLLSLYWRINRRLRALCAIKGICALPGHSSQQTCKTSRAIISHSRLLKPLPKPSQSI